MMKELRRMHAQSRSFKQRVRKYKEQPEMKNTIIEMKNTLEGVKSRQQDGQTTAPLPVCFFKKDKVLLEHSYAYLLMYCIQLFCTIQRS